MKNNCFYCKNCQTVFNTPKYYFEKHGFDAPPYEKIAICPKCEVDNFFEFNTTIEKNEVVEGFLPALMYLNRHINNLQDLLGVEIKNNDLSTAVEIMAESIIKMFEFVDGNIQKKILLMDNENELQKILMYLTGEV